jgi:glutathione S-transferase
MKLYYSPGACSMAAHIALREAGLKFETEKVDLKEKRTSTGADYTRINPKGYVPALELENGQVLTEAGVVIQYIADQKADLGLAPKVGTLDRYRMMEWIHFVSTEIHKQFGPLFKPDTPEETKQAQKELLGKRFDYLAEQLKGKQFLMGEKFTVVDAYLFTVLKWTDHLKIDLAPWPILQTYVARVATRPAVVETLKAEGLAK